MAMQKNYRPGGVGMIPAHPQTYLLHLYFDDDQPELVRTNVLGWQVGQDRRLTPLTLDPQATEQEDWFVAHPDGRVEGQDGSSWADLDSFIADRRRHRRHHA